MYQKASQRHLSKRFRSCKTHSYSIRTLFMCNCSAIFWNAPQQHRRTQSFVKSLNLRNTLRRWHYTFSTLSVCFIGGDQVLGIAQPLQNLQRKFSTTPEPTGPTGGEEYVSLPGHASASFTGKTVCPERCSDALFWEWELTFPNFKALQITEPCPSFSQDQDLQGMLTLKDQSF